VLPGVSKDAVGVRLSVQGVGDSSELFADVVWGLSELNGREFVTGEKAVLLLS